ncbi:MAG: type IV toxin-antitoxin system AbiEi family antitoxin domain-containing protein [Nocardioides sp.]|nr:type IV toxin-antitoxin system AbiEi family antitoxin domain-containing protein [Nocardioides sp.]
MTTTRDLSGAVFLRRDLLKHGYNDKTIQRHLRAGAWRRVRHGAYCDAGLWDELSAEDRHRLLARAVLRTAHPNTVLSHVSAALEHGAPVWGIALDEVHVTRTDGKPRRREAGVVHHCGELDPEQEVRTINGVRVTAPLRAALEVMTIATVEPALVTVDGLLRLVDAAVEELSAARKQVKHWPHSLTCEVVLRLADPRHESALETRAAHLLRAHRLPAPVPQVEVFDESGMLFARVDFAWVALGVFLEADGKAKYHQFRRRGESLEDFLMREKQREERICQLTGWVCIRLSWADIEKASATAARVQRLLESRTRAG